MKTLLPPNEDEKVGIAGVLRLVGAMRVMHALFSQKLKENGAGLEF